MNQWGENIRNLPLGRHFGRVTINLFMDEF